jgi:protein subunit release factor B
MRFNDLVDVSPAKVQALRAQLLRLKMDLAHVQEQFTRGSGPGGQKINKTANRVVLRYEPLNLVVRVQQDRRRSINRFLALRELADQAEMRLSPHTSERLKEQKRIRRQKDRRARRHKSPDL